MTIETLDIEIKKAIESLHSMTKDFAFNLISKDYVFILSNINDFKSENVYKRRLERKRINNKKKPISFDPAINELKSIYNDLYDINLYIYKSKKKYTIIEIQYFPKSSLDKDFLKTVIDNEPMLHCKVSMPQYRSDKKFDINWEHGGLKHHWKIFWWKYRINKELKTLGNKSYASCL